MPKKLKSRPNVNVLNALIKYNDTDKSKILPSHLPHGALVSVGDVVRTADGFQLIGTSEVVEINITEDFIGNKLQILYSFNHFTYVLLFKPANLAND